MPLYVLFFGPPGVGKGTQAQKAATKFAVPHISTGEMFRAELQQGSSLADELRSFMDAGKLVPDELTTRVVNGRLAQSDVMDAGFILDGYPRTLGQAQALDQALEDLTGMPLHGVVNFTADADVLVKRITGRRICPTCARVFHIRSVVPRVAGKCDDDGTDLVQRPDDTEAIVTQRLAEYRAQTEPLVQFYRDRDQLTNVIATAAPDIVFETVCRILGRMT